ncbi:MBL fold metallo-hydrolase [Halobacteria archaeon AArc-dxtr1]|nr:MBL fold metallo-hydrolase [Halobacteria archaeon AArc-dxtr1]
MRRALIVGCVVFLVALAGCLGTGGVPEDDSDATVPDGELEIHHVDVGQADSTLLVTPDGETILVDTGDWRQDGADVIDALESAGIDRIDHLVATHAHADHIGGHAAVIEHFETEHDGVGAIYDSGVPHDSATYESYLDAVEAYGHELLIVEEGDTLPIDDEAVTADVVNPPSGESGGDLHYNSVALVVEFGEVRYLTTGDAEADAEERLVDERGDEIDADIYQAGHHGSATSSTPDFVDAVDPEIAVISSGYDSQYGHPHDDVVERFADRGIETYWTGVHGDIVLTTDGESIEVSTSQSFSTDAADLLDETPDDEDESPAITPPPSAPAMDSTPLASRIIDGASASTLIG